MANENQIVVKLDKIALLMAQCKEGVGRELEAIEALLGEEGAPPTGPGTSPFQPTEGLEPLFVHPGPVVIGDWSDAVVQDIVVPERYRGRLLTEWRYRALIQAGPKTGLQNWFYFTRAPHKWGMDGKIGDVLAMASTSANGRWILEARVDRFRGDAPNAPAHIYDDTVVLDVWYDAVDHALDITVDGVRVSRLEGVPAAALSGGLRVQWGSGRGEPAPHATNEGSRLLAAILEVEVEGAAPREAQSVEPQPNASIANLPEPLAMAKGVENAPSSPITAATQ